MNPRAGTTRVPGQRVPVRQTAGQPVANRPPADGWPVSCRRRGQDGAGGPTRWFS